MIEVRASLAARHFVSLNSPKHVVAGWLTDLVFREWSQPCAGGARDTKLVYHS